MTPFTRVLIYIQAEYIIHIVGMYYHVPPLPLLQTTPVWRAGPHGPKTLCNACGVRYMKVAKGNVTPTPRRQQH